MSNRLAETPAESDAKVTSINIRERLTSTINYMKSWMNTNDQLYQAEQQAHYWERYASPVGHCEIHDCAMFRDIAKAAQGLPEDQCYTCNWCVKEKHEQEIADTRRRTTQALYYPNAGLLMSAARATLQQNYIRSAISNLSTSPTSHEQSSEEIDISTIPTNHLRGPATPTPETRAELFRDANPSSALIPEDKDKTEMDLRKVIMPRKLDTQEFPALRAESLLVELMGSPAHERGTGEQEPVQEKHWML